MFANTLGAVGRSDLEQDEATPLQLDYYRQKINEFQNVLVQMDSAAEGAQDLIDIGVSDVSLLEDLNSLLAEYDLKKGFFRTAAEGLNFAISGVNLVGADFPSIKIPRGLNAIPLVAAAGIAAALAVAAGLIVWGRDWIKSVDERARRSQILEALPDGPQRAQAALAMSKIDGAVREADASPLGSIANIVKWVAIAGLVYFGLQTFKELKA
jgi:hypothetical protein